MERSLTGRRIAEGISALMRKLGQRCPAVFGMLESAGLRSQTVYLFGGAVRDAVVASVFPEMIPAGWLPKDWDFVTVGSGPFAPSMINYADRTGVNRFGGVSLHLGEERFNVWSIEEHRRNVSRPMIGSDPVENLVRSVLFSLQATAVRISVCNQEVVCDFADGGLIDSLRTRTLRLNCPPFEPITTRFAVEAICMAAKCGVKIDRDFSAAIWPDVLGAPWPEVLGEFNRRTQSTSFSATCLRDLLRTFSINYEGALIDNDELGWRQFSSALRPYLWRSDVAAVPTAGRTDSPHRIHVAEPILQPIQ